jgi:N-acyl-L-homoserine lactone synthetase
MIQIIDGTNARHFRELLRAFSALRYDVFVGKMGWRLPCREPGFEEDDFDDENATYLISSDGNGQVMGGARLLDTSRRSLLAEVFPYLVNGPSPADPKVFEVTRFLAAPRERMTATAGNVCMELLWGLQAFGVWAGLTHLVSVSHLGIEPILRRAGYRFRRLGEIREMDGLRIAALQHEVDVEVLEQLQQRVSGGCGFATPRGHVAPQHPAGACCCGRVRTGEH